MISALQKMRSQAPKSHKRRPRLNWAATGTLSVWCSYTATGVLASTLKSYVVLAFSNKASLSKQRKALKEREEEGETDPEPHGFKVNSTK